MLEHGDLVRLTSSSTFDQEMRELYTQKEIGVVLDTEDDGFTICFPPNTLFYVPNAQRDCIASYRRCRVDDVFCKIEKSFPTGHSVLASYEISRYSQPYGDIRLLQDINDLYWQARPRNHAFESARTFRQALFYLVATHHEKETWREKQTNDDRSFNQSK